MLPRRLLWPQAGLWLDSLTFPRFFTLDPEASDAYPYFVSLAFFLAFVLDSRHKRYCEFLEFLEFYFR